MRRHLRDVIVRVCLQRVKTDSFVKSQGARNILVDQFAALPVGGRPVTLELDEIRETKTST